jgi:hypothetical protein
MRSAVSAGLVCFAPLACWLLLELRAMPLPALAAVMMNAIVSVQAVAIALWIPLLPRASTREHVVAATLLVLIPAPLGALLWLSGGVSLAALGRAQLGLLALALLVAMLSRVLGHSVRLAPLLRASFAVVLAAALWQLRPHWLVPLLT